MVVQVDAHPVINRSTTWQTEAEVSVFKERTATSISQSTDDKKKLQMVYTSITLGVPLQWTLVGERFGDQRDGVKKELISLFDNIQSIVAVSLFFASSEGSVGLN